MAPKCIAFLLLCMALVAGEARAQASDVPSGWETLSTAHFTFRYHPRAGSRVRPIAQEAEQDLVRILSLMGLDDVDPMEVRVARNTQEMAAVKPGSPPPQWATGLALRPDRIILVSLTAPDGAHPTDASKIFLHEVVHVVEWDATGGRALPIWFSEGLAIHLSGEFSFARNKVLLSASLRGDLLPLSRLSARYPGDGAEVNVAYAQSADIVKFLDEAYGPGFIARLLSRVRRGDDFQFSLESLAGRSLGQIQDEWMAQLNVWYRWVPSLTGGATLWVLIAFILIGVYIRRRKQVRQTLERWEREEEERRKQMAQLLKEHWDPSAVPRLTDDRSQVIHEGESHTLH